jgi:diguanylate cyclase (GGDEF)-like protein/excisionase family DNA binding protein
VTPATGSPDIDRAHRLAEAAVAPALDRARRAERPLAVLVVAVDDVGRVDRVHGHAAGARVVAAIEQRVRELAPASATVVRMARERIVVVAEQSRTAREALDLAAALAGAAREPLSIEGVPVRLDATVGVAVADEDQHTAATLLRDADGAAQRVRANGRGAWKLADMAARERDLRRLQLEAELADALARGELALYLQPIVSLRRDALLGVEALVRWRHPTRGLIGPAQFLPVAEESGLIVDIGDWMLRAVCQELERWDARDPERALPVSLNVSARELREASFATRFADALAASQLPAERLVLEIAEPEVLQEPGAGETLAALRGLGVGLVLDRFGGAGSALAHLTRHPFDGLKLDRALLHPDAPEGEAAIVEAVVQLAHALGLSITIPGIETEQQLAVVRALHVDAAQGHLIARPAPAGAIADPGELSRTLAAPARRGAAAGGERGEEWLSLSAVAEALGVSPSTVRRLADQGVLPGARTEGGHRRFLREDVQRLARERQQAPSLRPWELPTGALPAAAELLAQDGRALAERAGRALYEPGRPGWFAAPQGLARARSWLDALSGGLAAGNLRDCVSATAAYADAATLGGATPAEVVRFLGQFGALATHELVRARAAGEEARAMQRVMSAGAETFLERM